jgi:hypothetical protein
MTSSAEMWEQHDCLTNAGTKKTTYGLGYSLWTGQGFVDWLVNDWIDVSLSASGTPQFTQ